MSGTDIIPGRVVDYGRLEFIDREPPVLRCRCGYEAPVVVVKRRPDGVVDITYQADNHPCEPRRLRRPVRGWSRRMNRVDRPSRGQRIHERRRKTAERRR